AWVGDHFQIATVGIAVDPAHNPLDSPAVQALVRANRRALKTMADQPDLAARYIGSFLNRMTHQEVQRYYQRYIQPYYTADGRVNLDVGRRGIDAVAAELGVAPIPAEAFYYVSDAA
ncbi:MAG TPA: ABC transporter substrate-binding protein, partial [Mycobacterium sp.]